MYFFLLFTSTNKAEVIASFLHRPPVHLRQTSCTHIYLGACVFYMRTFKSNAIVHTNVYSVTLEHNWFQYCVRVCYYVSGGHPLTVNNRLSLMMLSFLAIQVNYISCQSLPWLASYFWNVQLQALIHSFTLCFNIFSTVV